MIGFMETTLSEMWSIIIVMVLECLCVCLLCLNFRVLLCLNCAFKIPNELRNISANPRCEHYDDLGDSQTLCLLFMTVLNYLDMTCEIR